MATAVRVGRIRLSWTEDDKGRCQHGLHARLTLHPKLLHLYCPAAPFPLFVHAPWFTFVSCCC